ncbi:DUF1353 domain-containing protein [Helicobacter winghamensis]|uniref:DUF1353 domain-containing protein n=1 Tax=Helicobacter winghamensis TaxID=157268 RepID=UPI00279D1714
MRDLITILREGVQFELLEPFRFYFKGDFKSLKKLPFGILELDEIKGGVFIQTPKGFKTDFGSIPQLFQSLISPVGKPTKAFVLHDYLCALSNAGKLKRKVADEVFKDALKQLGCGLLKRYLLYFGVRVFSMIVVPTREKLFKAKF